MIRNVLEIKEKIINFLEKNGPTIPIYISREIGMDLMFTSAFLSELISEKRIKSTYLRVGSSAIYFLEGQEEKLEIFSEHLKSKEKEAYEKLKKERFLEDDKEEPALRIALNSIKDFAIPLKKEDNKLIWKYFLEKNSPKQKEDKIEKLRKLKNEKKFPEKKKKEKKISEKKEEKFLEAIKEKLKENNEEIEEIMGLNKDMIILRVIKGKNKRILIVLNKKLISEKDILNVFKRVENLEEKYSILIKGEPSKKIKTLFNAFKNLDSIEST